MFERISGFFKRFTRRRVKQSGETTIMDGKGPGADELGLDESFGDLEESIDAVGTARAGAETGPGLEVPVSEGDLGLGEDISTGASDFDERTISDEISGVTGTGFAEEAAAPGAEFQGEGEAAPFAEAFAEEKPASFVKRVLTLAVVGVIAIIVGGVAQFFLWPIVGKLVGVSGGDEPKLDVQTQVNSEQRKNAKLKSEVAQFKAMGSPTEVKSAQQQLTQLRDSQGAVEEVEKANAAAKEKETAYNELVAKISGIESDVAKTRADIGDIKTRIIQARTEVASLAKRTDQEYERFQLELARAELNKRLLIELQMEDIDSFRAELAKLSDHLSEIAPAAPAEPPAASAPIVPAATTEPAAVNTPTPETTAPQNPGS
ncbi:hypothetical protein HZA56_16450 [Candidatus Poribacteria bacterium]|nr:hypothetical protein [Candidatus Poribacteria bacterium]